MEPAGIRPEEAVSGPPFSSTGRTSNTPPRRLSTTRVRPWESAAPDLPHLYRLGVALWGALSGVGVLGGGGRGGRGAGGGGSLITSCRCRVAQLRNDRLQGEAAEHPRGEYGISLTSTFYSFLRVAGCDCGAGSPPTGGGSTLRGKAGRHPGARYTRARGWRDSCASLAIPPRTGLSASYSAQLSAVRPRAVRPRAAIMTGVARGTMEERSAGADSRLQARL